MEQCGFESQKNVAEKLNNKFKNLPLQLSCDTQIRIIIQVACETEWTVSCPRSISISVLLPIENDVSKYQQWNRNTRSYQDDPMCDMQK